MSEPAWLPNLVDGVPLWHIADDLNRPELFGGRLLVPDVEGPATLPRRIAWHVADCLPLEEARAREPERVRAAEAALVACEEAFDRALSEPASPFARYKKAFSLPPREAPDSWFFDPTTGAVRIANWAATQRRAGAPSHPERTTSRFGSQPDRGSTPSRPPATEAVPAPVAPGRAVRLVAPLVTLVFVAAVAFSWCALRPSAAPPAAAAPLPPASSGARADRDDDGTEDAADECPDVPGSRRGCPEAGEGIVVTRDRIDTAELVFFQTGSAKLDPRAVTVLGKIAALLVATPSIVEVLVEGHADAVGDDTRNDALSAARAAAARDVLVAGGVAKDRVRIASHGARDRRVDTRSAAAENRRVEIHITKVAP